AWLRRFGRSGWVQLFCSFDLSVRSEVIIEQARLVLAGCEAADLLPPDLELVRAAHAERFG
ncbi:MAG: hypothetical protein M3137_12195, partial [Actinomycetota bacterium]|nr:hypothetical protein [Actinomycetota bacterium]